jgi:plastocyanin
MRPTRIVASLAAVAAAAFVVVAAASGSASHRQVEVRDACDGPSFNAALNDESACVRNGGVTFDRFIGQLMSMGRAPAWRFAPDRLELAPGGTIEAYNKGGEFHTFTEVAEFGGGCIEPLNAILGLTPVAECSVPGILGTTGIPAGGELETVPLGPGIHRFECLIHPWMRTTVTVS